MYDTVKPTMTIHKHSIQHRPVVVGDVVMDGSVVVCGAAIFNNNKKTAKYVKKNNHNVQAKFTLTQKIVIFTRMIRYDMIRYASIRSVIKKVAASLVYHTRS